MKLQTGVAVPRDLCVCVCVCFHYTGNHLKEA